MVRKVFGVGVLDSDYPVKIKTELDRVEGKRRQREDWVCPYYMTWYDMLRRAYSVNFKNKAPCYKDVTCSDEWLSFKNFRVWCIEQGGVFDCFGNKLSLDKDILQPNVTKKVYSPSTCILVPKTLNGMLIGYNSVEGFTGVSVPTHKCGFVSRVSNPLRNTETSKSFHTPEEAYLHWMNCRLKVFREVFLVYEISSDVQQDVINHFRLLQKGRVDKYKGDGWFDIEVSPLFKEGV